MGFSPEVVQLKMQEIRQDHYLDLRSEISAVEVSQYLQRVTRDLNRRWYDVPDDSPLIGMTLEQTDMRYLIGVSLMAIRRADGTEIDYPHSQVVLETGDRLLVVGATQELAALAEFAEGNIAVSGEDSACQWVTVPPNSPILGKKIVSLNTNNHYQFQIKAIRRDGKFSPVYHKSTELKADDQLLLCGSISQLIRLKKSFDLPLEIEVMGDW